MPLQIWFWVLYVICVAFGMWSGRVPGQPYTYRNWGANLVIFILLGILGWAQFGPPVK